MPLSAADWKPIAVALLAPSLLSLGCYVLVRWLEMSFPIVLQTMKILTLLLLTLLGLFLFGLFFFIAPIVPLLVWFFIFGPLSIPGAKLHRVMSGNALEQGPAFQTVLYSVWLSQLLGCILPLCLNDIFSPLRLRSLGSIYGLGILIYPLLAPVAVWAWLSLKVRPGIDEAFEE